ncbi:MAG: IS630 family transposase, partial [Pseudomonadota bacterium]
MRGPARSGGSSIRAGSATTKSGHAGAQERKDVRTAREAWLEGPVDLDLERLILIDETGLNTKSGRPRGRSEKGECPRLGLPQGHWRTTSFVAGLRLSGIDAPMLLDGAIDGDALGAYVRQLPVPA